MNIVSVIPNEDNSFISTTIWARPDSKSLPVPYVYSHSYELIHDPNKSGQWMGWNGGTLTEAIQFIIAQ